MTSKIKKCEGKLKKAVRVGKWIILNAFVFWLAWEGLHEQAKWAENVLKFLVWLNFCMWLVVFLTHRVKANEKLLSEKIKNGHAVPMSISLFVDIALACFLASYGKFFYATLVVITGSMQLGVYSHFKQMREFKEKGTNAK